ncbi:MAG TPA: YhcH/YjgK/YiaL family protein, partial [Tepidisphaeraceae bacterium]|nr:YhcH/YjgK/YiaL family protein [Tepidisphaeraceae bacterium]
HRRYADVQFVLRGSEVMGWLPLSAARERTAYDATKDVVFFEPPSAGSAAAARPLPTLAVVPAGVFAVFFPTDVHMPQAMTVAGPADVRKVVVKVAV